jgi:hypothetical protein
MEKYKQKYTSLIGPGKISFLLQITKPIDKEGTILK